MRWKDYQGNLLLVGINYDKATKKHECVIEKIKSKDSITGSPFPPGCGEFLSPSVRHPCKDGEHRVSLEQDGRN